MLNQKLNKSDLIERMAKAVPAIPEKDVEDCVKSLIDYMAHTLAHARRIEIRGFGSFSLNERRPRLGRNPRTGESVDVGIKYVPHFKPGKELRSLVNESSAPIQR